MVVHVAAETHVDRSITNAAPFLRTNVEGTAVLLNEARALGVQRFVNISTDEVYGPVPEGAVDEQAPLAPRSPYAASKAAADLLVQAFHATYGLPTIVVRPTNVFGPAQLPEKFIPLCIVSGLERLPIPIYGDGAQRRGWLFVEDVCAAIRLVVERGAVGEIYNVGSGHEQANLETARSVLRLLERPAELLRHVEDRPAHDRRYAMKDDKVRSLGWKPITPFADGLAETARWYQAHTDWWRPVVQRLHEDPYHWLNRAAGSGTRQAARAGQ
jgi:dTDP-glucose 4,6-dehydratase